MPLGRGLQSLIPSARGAVTTHAPLSGDKIWQIPVGEIIANRDQPRHVFNEEELAELVSSIKEHGILQPLIVSEKTSGGYELIAGERRLRAAKKLGLATVPTIVRTTKDHERLELAIIENVQRVDLSPIDEAFSYARLHEEFGMGLDAVAERVGKSRPHVSNMIRLLELPEEAKDALAQGKITMGKARALLSLSTEAEQLQVLRSMLGEGMTTREVEAAVQRRSQKSPKAKNADLQYLESELRSLLGTKIKITKRGERGTIVMDFYSNEELEGLVSKLRRAQE